MAVPVLMAQTAASSSGLQKTVDSSIQVPMKSHAAPAASEQKMQRARRLASTKGFFTQAGIPSVRKAVSTNGDALPELYGSVIYADGWTLQENEVGMYRIGTSDNEPFTRMGDARVDATAGGVGVGDTYWASYFVEVYGNYFAYTAKYDISTWEEDKKWDYWSDMKMMSTGVVYDRVTKKVYGCFYNDNTTGFVFGTVDYTTKKRTIIKNLDRKWSAVAISRKGQLYAIDELGDLYSVDKATGEMNAIGSTGLVATNPSSACIDPRSGRCFYAVTQGTDGSLYEIDLNTAQSTLVYHFPKNQEVVGLFVPLADADDNAPDAVGNLQVDFTGGSLSGTVSFTMPSTTFEGMPAEGNISYVIEADGMTLVSKEAAYGESVVAPVTFSVPGDYTFKVYAVNSVGNGPATEARIFIGNDLPNSPQLTATITDGVVSLSWEPVASSVNGGYIDVENLTYKVVRFPDNHVVEAATRQTSATDTPPVGGNLTGYWYVVTANSGAYASAEAVSRKFWIGALIPPYSVVFDKEAKGEAFLIHDANNDGKTWAWSEYDKAFKTIFNRSADNDDWLVTPPLKLEKGKMYTFTAKLRTYLGNPLDVEIRWGADAIPEALTEVLMEKQTIKNRNVDDYSFYILPEADGTYYVGIRDVTSASNSWSLYVEGVSVSAGAEAVIPDVVTDFTVTPDFDGAKKTVVKLNAPQNAVNGTPITALTKVDVMRDGKVVKSFPAPAPGESLEFTDEVSEIGYYKYEAVACNQTGAGKKSAITVFVGANEPAKPAWVKINETSNPGEVTLTWERVTTDKDGNPLNPDLVSYTIVAAGEGEDPVFVAENIKGDSHTFNALEAGVQQSFVGYGLRAQTEGGYSLMAISDLIPVGTPYAVPYEESFADGEANSLIRSENREGMWNMYNDDAGIPSQDGDNGMVAMFGEFAGADATLYSGKISLEGVKNPALMFYTYNIEGEDGDQNEIEVYINGGDGFKMEKYVLTWTLGGADGWYLVVVPLNAYRDKTVQFALRGITQTRKFTLVDNIRVGSLDEHNLRIVGINAPASVQAGHEFFVTVIVDNPSVNEAANFDVTLFRNGKKVAIECPAPLEVGDTRIVKFPQTLSVTDNEISEYHAVVEYGDDDNPDDNTSAKTTVELFIPNHPVPRNLSGTVEVNSVTLTWDAPDLANAQPDRITEDFEGFEAWSKTGAAGWTFVDVDQSGIGALSNIVLPGIDYNTLLSWFVTDASLEGLPKELFAASSGNKYLSTFFCLPLVEGEMTSYVANDDWAISPLLFGGAQSISLMARSLNPLDTEESFEIWISATQTDNPADFTLLKKVEEVPGSWTPYSFDLPEGTKHFAIRYNHTYGLSLGIDDVSFIPQGESSLVLEGYNVYRDGQRVNSTLVTQPTFTEDVMLMGSVSYAVTAVYAGEAGESRLTPPLVLSPAGIDQIVAASQMVVGVRPGAAVVVNATGLRVIVSDIAGHVVAACTADAVTEIPLASGFYVLNIGETAFKVFVP